MDLDQMIYTMRERLTLWWCKAVDILHFENTRGQRVDYKGTNVNARTQSTTFKQNIKPDRTKNNIFLKPKDDRTMAVDDVWSWIQGS